MKKEFVFIFVLIFLSFVSAADNFNISSSAGNNLFFVNGTTGNVNILKDLNVTGTIYGTVSGSSVWNRSSTNVFLANTGDNVGIGTNSPWYKLTTIAETGANRDIALFGVNGYSNGFTVKYEDSPQKMIYSFINGNVGIGTTSPTQKLSVEVTSGLPATSGTTQNGIARFYEPSHGITLDIGANSNSPYQTWIQATNTINLANTYSLLLNPNGGNVGIGTTSPTSKLEVSGAIGDASLSAENGITFIGDSDTGIEIGRGNSFTGLWLQGKKKSTDSSRDIVLNPVGGNVGIGTTSPVAKLSLVGTKSDTIGDTPYLGYDTDGVGSLFGFRLGADNNLYLDRRYSSTPYNVMSFIRSSGNVGIGTTTPENKLTVNGDLLLSGASGYRKLWLNSNGDLGTSARVGSIQKDYTTSPYNMNIYASYGLSGSSSPITFYRDSVNPTMIIDSSGNVGIGTTSPIEKLQVDGNIRINGGEGGYLSLFNTGQNQWKITTDGTALNFYETRTAGDRLTLATGGNVGIGTTSPAYPLSVKSQSGSALSSMYMTNDFVQGTSGSALLMTFGATSGNAVSKLQAVTTGNTVYGNLILNGAGGNVGIGTNSPDNKLTIVGEVDKIVSSVGTTASPSVEEAMVSKSTDFSHEAGMYDINSFTTNHAHWLKFTVVGTASDTPNDAMTIYHNGNVGIGTSSPNYKLTTLAETGANRDLALFGINTYSNGFTIKYEDSPQKMIYSFRDGNVGIGTNSPGALLHVNNSLTSTGTVGYFMRALDGDNEYDYIAIGRSPSNNNAGIFGYKYDTTVGAETAFISVWGDDPTAGTGLFVKKEGNVGIGTTIPLSKLSVGGVGDTNYAIYGTGGVRGVYGSGTDAGVYGKDSASGSSGLLGYHTYGVYGDGTTYGVYGSGDNTGVRGDGTTYGVYGSGLIGAYGASISGIGDGYGGYFIASGNSGFDYGVYGSGDNTGVRGEGITTGVSGSGTTYGVSGFSSANTGVVGSGGTYDFYATGAGTDYGTSSSMRWKENITEISNALDKVLNLRGVYFTWNGYNNNTNDDMGFIAEEVGDIVPEIVGFENSSNESNYYYNEKGEKKLYASGVDYGALTPMLVQAIKELKEEKDNNYEELKLENEELRNENNLIKEELCKKDNSYSWCKN